MSINSTLMTSRYPESFTLLDVIKDPNIHENLEKFYVPTIELHESIFIKKDMSIPVTDEGPKRVKFIYLDSTGKNNTDPDSSFIQIPLSCKGFIARLSISQNRYTAENLKMDYLIDISSIKYRVDTVMMRDGSNIVMDQVLHFENIEFADYYRIDFDRSIKEFILNKEILFNQYFR